MMLFWFKKIRVCSCCCPSASRADDARRKVVAIAPLTRVGRWFRLLGELRSAASSIATPSAGSQRADHTSAAAFHRPSPDSALAAPAVLPRLAACRYIVVLGGAMLTRPDSRANYLLSAARARGSTEAAAPHCLVPEAKVSGESARFSGRPTRTQLSCTAISPSASIRAVKAELEHAASTEAAAVVPVCGRHPLALVTRRVNMLRR